jgi:hypothetical protein
MIELPPNLNYASIGITPLLLKGIVATEATNPTGIKTLMNMMNNELFHQGVEILVCVPDSDAVNPLIWRLESSRNYAATNIAHGSLNIEFQDRSVVDFPLSRPIRYQIMPDTKAIPLNAPGKPTSDDNEYVGIYFCQNVAGVLNHNSNVEKTPFEIKALLRKAEDSLPF